MPRICVTFHPDTFEKLQTQAKNKKTTVSQYIRELTAIGLKIEEMTAQKEVDGTDKMKEIEMSDDLKALWKNSLRWELESLYLIRCLTHDLLPKNHEEYLDTAKQKAESFVEKLLQKQI